MRARSSRLSVGDPGNGRHGTTHKTPISTWPAINVKMIPTET